MIRLNVFLAKAGACSRRKADLLIKEGRVKINGRVVIQPWTEVADKDSVVADGKLLRAWNPLYLIVNKPRGVTVTLEDRHARRKITDIIPNKYGRVFPVGRLDKETTGLIIMTNDGDLCHELTHPRFEIEKEYIAAIEGPLDKRSMDRMQDGIEDEGDMLKVKSVSMLKRDSRSTDIRIVISEGKKRHIRRLLKKVGVRVLNLKRVRIGGPEPGALKEGKFRVLDRKEIYHLTLKKVVRNMAVIQ